jgi:hypothetical protein
LSNLTNPITESHTRKEIAKSAGVSEGTVCIPDTATPEEGKELSGVGLAFVPR